MRTALASLLSFAATCLYAPILAEGLAASLAPGLAGLAGYAGARALATIAHKLQSQEPPRKSQREPCRPRTTSSQP